MAAILFKNCALLVASEPELRRGMQVLVEGDRIRAVSAQPMNAGSATVVDVAGKTLMPGLIDAHVHTVAVMPDLAANAKLPNASVAYQAVPVLRSMLARGFTAVRDAGGADYFLADAVQRGWIEGPRIFPSGKALSQTGGHGDLRRRSDELEACPCANRIGALARVEDGVDAVRKAAREELQRGATQIKIMASGGVASPTDRIESTQYALDEIRAAVAEAEAQNTYVMAHAYTARAIRRAVECGVRTIEHGNLIDDETAQLMHDRQVYAVPTLATYEALAEHAAELGMPAESVAKIDAVREAGLQSLEIFKRAGVRMGFGSDLLGEMHRYQSTEFGLRRRVLDAAEIIASATTVGAEILQMEGRLGTIAPEALADLLVVDGDPLTDLLVLEGQGERIAVVMKNGVFFKNQLG